MSYQVLARKWRPKSFETIIGQDHVVRALSNALTQQRLHHAYLFTGTRGVGKTTLARILARALNCETGITATPCGVCSACQEIDKGRFVDLIEVDAASNTQVDNMRELLENAQYAPTSGRFKVYIIDEVHMLSRSAFNAMLKTLEEPPAHVKFILATTDPQKVPVTVLSRCLQFNLRQMSPPSIVEHLTAILGKENITFESPALHLLARAAEGSMRDALSLLDQAIAYGGGEVTMSEIRAMLGAIDQSYLFELLHALLHRDGAKLMEVTQQMEARSLSFDTALSELAQILHQIALAQSVPEALADDLPERDRLINLSQQFSPEETQLYYQITLLCRRDLGLAPDEFVGFSMAMLRMLSFKPANSGQTSAPVSNIQSIPAVEKDIPPKVFSATQALQNLKEDPPLVTNNAAEPARETKDALAENIRNIQEAIHQPSNNISTTINVSFDGNWRALIDKLKLAGMARMLAHNCEFSHLDGDKFNLTIASNHKHLLEASYQEKLRSSLREYFEKPILLQIEIGNIASTPALQIQQENSNKQSEAETAIRQDNFVQTLINDFGAEIIPSSIKPI